MENKDFMTVKQLADLLGISKIAVFKKIRKGEIKAIKAGRAYIIPIKNVSQALGRTISEAKKHRIGMAVKRVVGEYGDVLKLLGNE